MHQTWGECIIIIKKPAAAVVTFCGIKPGGVYVAIHKGWHNIIMKKPVAVVVTVGCMKPGGRT